MRLTAPEPTRKTQQMLTRRTLITALAAAPLAAPAILRAQAPGFVDYPFGLGAASGDPSADGFVIWTRLAPDPLGANGGMPTRPVAVQWEVAEDTRFQAVVARGEAVARPELAHAVHVEVGGLRPDRPYHYRFTCGGERTATGHARTLPLPGAKVGRIRFASAGCMHYEMGWYTAFRHMAADRDLAFVYHYGDYIYEGRRIAYPPVLDKAAFPRSFGAAECYTLDDYRRRYALAKLDPDLQAAHHALPFFVTFDDHEVQNNWVGEIDAGGAPSELFLTRRAAAFQAWYEHMPVRASAFPRGGHVALARSARIGDLVDLRILDTRQYRSDQPCDDGFKPRCPGMADPAAQVLGAAQEKALFAALAKRDTRWTALAQQVMMMDLDRRTFADETAPIFNQDSWAGYTAPRARLIERIGGGDVVVLTGDEHQNFAGQLFDARGRPVAVEFVATSISSGGDGQDVRPGNDRIMADNPGLAFTNDQRGYAVCDVTPERYRTDFMVMDRVTTPGGTLSRRASYAVEHGRPVLAAVS